MDFGSLITAFNLSDHMLALMLGMPRLFTLVQVAPFMAGGIVTGQLRMTVVFACYLIVHPLVFSQLPAAGDAPLLTAALYAALIVKEVLLGFLLGFMAGILFWSFQSAGFFIDNQRGASMASESDPLSGEQTSPFGSLLFQGLTFLFFAGGVFTSFLGVIYATYVIWPPPTLIPLSVFADIRIPLFFAEQVCLLMLTMLMLAGPIVIACLLTDISLGLINRFASQLNVYVLAMPIKSGVASFLLVFYFAMLLRDAMPMFLRFEDAFARLRSLLS